jgi:triosephosphate isomerase (TIM)
VSAQMLSSIGVKAVIIGHSERRSYYGETNEILLKKVKQVLGNGMKPIFCCGEVLQERESGKHFEVVKNQIDTVLFALNEPEFMKVIIAYEPVWAIGTGKTATSDQAQEMHAFIRSLIAEKLGSEIALDTSILYGGSCKASNAKELFSKPDVDGGLIGGASLQAEEFMGIVNGF